MAMIIESKATVHCSSLTAAASPMRNIWFGRPWPGFRLFRRSNGKSGPNRGLRRRPG